MREQLWRAERARGERTGGKENPDESHERGSFRPMARAQTRPQIGNAIECVRCPNKGHLLQRKECRKVRQNFLEKERTKPPDHISEGASAAGRESNRGVF